MPLIHRDISWLSFNYRVLQEAKDPGVPLIERIKFFAIFSSNLSEFFKVRMANHRFLLRLGKKTQRELDYSPKNLIQEVQHIVNDQQQECSDLYDNELLPALESNGIYILKREELNDEQREYVSQYFEDNMLPYVQPVLLMDNRVRPFLKNSELYLAVLLRPIDHPDKDKTETAIVSIPSSHLPRLVKLPSPKGERHLILLDDIVRQSISWIFPGFDILGTYSIKLTRDAELYIEDEFSGDLIAKIKQSLNKRQVGSTSRFVYDRRMRPSVLEELIEVFDLEEYDLLKEGRYHNNSDFFKFSDFNLPHLKDEPLPPIVYKPLEQASDYWAAIAEKDHLLHTPYHSYESVVRFFENAAKDPNVTHIKIVQYRVAKKSRIMKALMRAVKEGKQVSAFIEVKARFDEEANLTWGERLEQAGVRVKYSIPGIKVHSKLALIRRKEKEGHKLYTYLSTGNFHERTAKIYSDLGVFTADKRITSEVARVFSFLETAKLPFQSFEHLLVGIFNLRDKINELIDFEIAQAKAGKKAEIFLKLNSLEDKRVIAKLYEASQAGVKVKLVIRGICCLVPGVKGWSENIEAVSIVDRYLEHARVYVFEHGGENKIYLASADWMKRNLSRRVETAIPIYSEDIRTQILDILNIQWHDNVKSRKIDQKQSNQYHVPADSDGFPVRSQTETYYYCLRRLEQEEEDEG